MNRMSTMNSTTAKQYSTQVSFSNLQSSDGIYKSMEVSIKDTPNQVKPSGGTKSKINQYVRARRKEILEKLKGPLFESLRSTPTGQKSLCKPAELPTQMSDSTSVTGSKAVFANDGKANLPKSKHPDYKIMQSRKINPNGKPPLGKRKVTFLDQSRRKEKFAIEEYDAEYGVCCDFF